MGVVTMTRSAAIVCFALLLGASAIAAPSSQPATEDRVAELIRQLDADEWAARQRAEDALVRLGEPALQPVQQALEEAADLEVRMRLQTVLARIERERAFGVTRITLDLKSATARQIVDEISRQAGASIRLQNDGSDNDDTRADFRFDEEPFWSAVTKVCAAYDLYPSGTSHGRRGLQLTRGNGSRFRAPHSSNGPFLVMLNSVQHSHNLNLAQPQAVESSSYLQMTVLAEPKLTILGHSYMPVITQAVNENGQSLAMPHEYGGHFSSDEGSVWSVNVPLLPLAATSQKIASLRGTLSASVQVRSQSIEVTDITRLRDQSHTVGPRRVILHELNEKDGSFVLRVTVFHTREEMNGRGVHSLVQGLRLYDEAGRAFQTGGQSGRNYEEHKAEFDIHFSRHDAEGMRLRKPTKLVWTIPTETREIEIPFDFKDVPLQ
jgi:hypothetical protein